MKNKNTFLASATAALAAASSLGLMPAASAADIYMNPNAAITKQWQKNTDAYGKPLSKELCVTGTGCAQQFENAVITWSRNTGVKVLNGAERAQAYVDAGGVKTLGALESDAWNNSFCGPSVTTFNGSNSSRWLLVVDEGKASVGSKIDLNSDAGKKWLAERAQTKQCFGAEDTGIIESEWMQATQAPVGPPRDYNSYSDWFIDEGWKYTPNRDFIGEPLAAATWNGNTSTQEFTGGTVTWTRGDISPVIKLNLTGAKERALYLGKHSKNYIGEPTGDFTKVNDRIYIEDLGEFVYVYDAEAGNVVVMDSRVYKNFMAEPDKFGTPVDYFSTGGDRSGELIFHYTAFDQGNGRIAVAEGLDTQTASVEVYNNGISVDTYTVGTEPVWVPTDPATVDWSKAGHVNELSKERFQALYFQDGKNSSIIIAADQQGKPLQGAQAFRSDWLGAHASRESRFMENQFTEWVFGDFSGWGTDVTALGVPVAEHQIVVEDGVTYELQEFQGGSIKWPMITETQTELKNAEITLNDWGKARLAEYDAEARR